MCIRDRHNALWKLYESLPAKCYCSGGIKMTQKERRLYLIKELLAEQLNYSEIEIPESVQEQKNLLRSLFNMRPPRPVSKEFLKMCIRDRSSGFVGGLSRIWKFVPPVRCHGTSD